MRAKVAYSTNSRILINGSDTPVYRRIDRYLWDRRSTEAFVGSAPGRRFLVVRVRRLGTFGFEACDR